jgi:hypothetical protein
LPRADLPGNIHVWGRTMLELVQMALAVLILVPCAGLVLHTATRAQVR